MLAGLIPPGARVHDPFAGGGERLGKLADERGWVFTGTELEAPFINDPRVAHGNALDPDLYPANGYVVVTSPVYPNGIADHFHARDSSTRRTYRSALAKLTGRDRPLDPDNMGRWGYRGTPLHSPARRMYWHLASQAAANWGGAVALYVNVSDFKAGDRTEPVVDGWVRLLEGHGWRLVAAHPVVTRRWRHGANREARVDGEVVLHLRPSDGP